MARFEVVQRLVLPQSLASLIVIDSKTAQQSSSENKSKTNKVVFTGKNSARDGGTLLKRT